MLTDADIKKVRYLMSLRETHFLDGLRNKDFTGVDLTKADLHEMQIINVNFKNAILDDVNFYDSQLINCNFNGANIKRAILRKSSIMDCTFDKTEVAQADMSEAAIYNTISRVTICISRNFLMPDY